jgi:DNA-binding transcriptional LysR family regulator
VVIQHLRYAVAAEEQGSFRKAAMALDLRQSTLSRSIQQLESKIGVAIFNRSSGGVRATTCGRDFLRGARSIVEQIDLLIATAQSKARGEAGWLAIGFYTSLSAGNLRAVVMAYSQRFPHVELRMVEGSRKCLMTAQRSGIVDVVIVAGEEPFEGSKSVALWSERILIALPDDHPLAAKETVNWTDLGSEVVLLSNRDAGPELQNMLMAKLMLSGNRPNISRHDVSRAGLMGLIGARLGVSLVTEAAVGAKLNGLVYRELRDGSGPALQAYAAYWREDNENPALANFLKLLGERYPLAAIAGS